MYSQIITLNNQLFTTYLNLIKNIITSHIMINKLTSAPHKFNVLQLNMNF